jgi:hypothetical protein
LGFVPGEGDLSWRDVGDGDVGDVGSGECVAVEPPASRQEEFLAARFFSEDVGRILAFSGSRTLDEGNAVLREVVDHLGERRVALHARYALGKVLATQYKELVVDHGRRQPLAIEVHDAEQEEAQELIGEALTSHPETSIESFGHIEFRHRADRFGEWLSGVGAEAEAAEARETVYETLVARTVHGTRIRPDSSRRPSQGNGSARRRRCRSRARTGRLRSLQAAADPAARRLLEARSALTGTRQVRRSRAASLLKALATKPFPGDMQKVDTDTPSADTGG